MHIYHICKLFIYSCMCFGKRMMAVNDIRPYRTKDLPKRVFTRYLDFSRFF